jgi:hypothetical protein
MRHSASEWRYSGAVSEGGDPRAEVLAALQALPAAAVEALFGRYGKPLAVELEPARDGEPVAEVVRAQGGTARVRTARIRVPVDVIANDWFVWEVAGEDPVAIPGPLFAAAVAALGRVARGERDE